MSLEGKIQIQADIVPTNDNERMAVTDVKYVKGAPILAQSIAGLIAQHPNRLKLGNQATVYGYPNPGVVTDFRLVVEPSTLVDSNGDSIINIDNFDIYWIVQSSTQTASTRVYQYAPDGPGGGAPLYPYEDNPAAEVNWKNTRDDSAGHKWLRFRDDDVDANDDGIFDNWSVPISFSTPYATGDYIENRFKRQIVSTSVISVPASMTNDKYYIVESGQVQIDGDLTLAEIGYYGTDTTAVMYIGRTFKKVAGLTYTFLNSGTVTETLKAPPRTISGVPNNEPAGWTDSIPGGTDQLWQITGQKSVYGQLKSDWTLSKINENPDYVRYSNNASPHPDTIVGINDPATTGSAGDLALIAEGWVSVYAGQDFMATRSDDPGAPLYTPWLVQKINEESGEYVDHVYKLFSINLDADSVLIVAPTLRDPTQEGWSDVPLPETDTTINYESTARKFYNGELKTSWSKPIPYTGKDTFNDVIAATPGDNFKYDSQGNVEPAGGITLQANLYKGLSKLWENTDVSITYAWKKVYDNGAIVDVSPTSNPADPFYTLGAALPIRANQRVVVKADGVTGLAVFRCTQTVTFATGDPLVFEEEISLLDVSDGIDAKALAVTADAPIAVFDTVNLVFSPVTMVLRTYVSNLVAPTINYFRRDGGVWTKLTGALPTGYGQTGSVLTINLSALPKSNLFGETGNSEEKLFAASTHATDPDSADYDTTFSDYITISKLGSANVGSPGENAVLAVLDNEAHTVVLDTVTGIPQAGEVAKATSKISVYDGTTKLNYNTAQYTVTVDNTTQFVVTNPGTGDAVVSLVNATWVNGIRSYVGTLTITYGAIVLTKKFSLSSTMDAPGAIILDIDSDKGFVFTPQDKTDKIFTAVLYENGEPMALPNAAYTFRWTKNNVAGSTSTTNFVDTITRAQILSYSEVTVDVFKDANPTPYRSRTVYVSDVNDGRSYRAWTDNATKPTASQDLTAQDPTDGGIWPVTVSGVIWRLPTDAHWATNVPTFAQDAEENAGVFTWGPVYQLKGEQGDQGPNGDFLHPLYKAEDPGPPAFGVNGNTSTLAQMKAVGWTSLLPGSGIIWKTDRLWNGEGVTFDVNGDPSTAPSGAIWSAAVRISGKDGATGSTGATGPQGPAGPTGPQGPTGPAGSPVVFGSAAMIYYKKLNSILVEGSGNVWNNGANGNSWADSSTYSESTSWTNTTGYDVYVRVDGEAAAYNSSLDGSAKFELKLQIGAGVPQLEVDFKRYSANILPNIFKASDYILVPNGAGLTVTTTIRAILNAPNYLWQRCGIKIVILA